MAARKFIHDTPIIEAEMDRPGDWYVHIEGKQVGGKLEMEDAKTCAAWLDDNWTAIARIAVTGKV